MIGIGFHEYFFGNALRTWKKRNIVNTDTHSNHANTVTIAITGSSVAHVNASYDSSANTKEDMHASMLHSTESNSNKVVEYEGDQGMKDDAV